ncbi:Cytochrome P450 89A9 [Glycine soja]
METWFVATILCLCLSVILKAIRNVFFSPLPPGPHKCSFRLLPQYLTDPKTILQKLHAKYGSIFTVHVGYSRTDIFIADRFLAHQALIQHGTVFADRPKANPTNKIISSNQHDILFSFYGPKWRLLRPEIGRDPTAWDDPLAFKPERFMNNGEQNGGTNFDIMGSKEIKMMPFGAGRRMCPGYALEILHLEYFVANFVWYFAWKVGNGDR